MQSGIANYAISTAIPAQLTPAIDSDPLTSPLATPDVSEPSPVPFDPSQRALEATQSLFPSLSGMPQVVYSANITSADFERLGLSQRSFNGGEPPMAYVLVQGDFDSSNFGIGMKSSVQRARFVAFVFDLRTWAIMTTQVLEDGAPISDLLAQLGIPTPAPTAIAPVSTTAGDIP